MGTRVPPDGLGRAFEALPLIMGGWPCKVETSVQTISAGKDLVITDFEGKPARPLSKRRIKRSPLRDVAGMLRFFHCAAYAGILSLEEHGLVRPEHLGFMELLAQFWYVWVSVTFLRAHFEVAILGNFRPQTGEDLQVLLDAYLLEKAMCDPGSDLNNRPGWKASPPGSPLPAPGPGIMIASVSSADLLPSGNRTKLTEVPNDDGQVKEEGKNS